MLIMYEPINIRKVQAGDIIRIKKKNLAGYEFLVHELHAIDAVTASGIVWHPFGKEQFNTFETFDDYLIEKRVNVEVKILPQGDGLVYYYINDLFEVKHASDDGSDIHKFRRQSGNYFFNTIQVSDFSKKLLSLVVENHSRNFHDKYRYEVEK